MNERLCLFFAGYCAYYPSLYYRKLAFIRDVESGKLPIDVKNVHELAIALNEHKYESDSRINTAKSIISFFDLDVQVTEEDFSYPDGP